jgi:hypothetical protein
MRKDSSTDKIPEHVREFRNTGINPVQAGPGMIGVRERSIFGIGS